jgi:hypothetical protein
MATDVNRIGWALASSSRVGADVLKISFCPIGFHEGIAARFAGKLSSLNVRKAF